MGQSKSNVHQFQTLDFTCYQQLRANPIIANRLIASYQKTFSDPEVWAEDYSYEDVDQKLKNELTGHAFLRIIVDGNKQNQVVAFCWAQLLNAEGIMSSITSIQYYQTLGKPELKAPLDGIIGGEPVLYLHDLAIAAEYRGKVNLRQLILPVLEGITVHTGVNELFFWSVDGTRVSSLANRAGIDLVTTLNGIQFFYGNVWNNNSMRVNSSQKKKKTVLMRATVI